MPNDSKMTVALPREDLDNALACLEASSRDPREPERYREAYARSYAALAEAIKTATGIEL